MREVLQPDIDRQLGPLDGARRAFQELVGKFIDDAVEVCGGARRD